MKRVAGNAKRAKNIKIEKASPARKSRFERAGYRMPGSWVTRFYGRIKRNG